jgi:hypothetical protein
MPKKNKSRGTAVKITWGADDNNDLSWASKENWNDDEDTIANEQTQNRTNSSEIRTKKQYFSDLSVASFTNTRDNFGSAVGNDDVESDQLNLSPPYVILIKNFDVTLSKDDFKSFFDQPMLNLVFFNIGTDKCALAEFSTEEILIEVLKLSENMNMDHEKPVRIYIANKKYISIFQSRCKAEEIVQMGSRDTMGSQFTTPEQKQSHAIPSKLINGFSRDIMENNDAHDQTKDKKMQCENLKSKLQLSRDFLGSLSIQSIESKKQPVNIKNGNFPGLTRELFGNA